MRPLFRLKMKFGKIFDKFCSLKTKRAIQILLTGSSVSPKSSTLSQRPESFIPYSLYSKASKFGHSWAQKVFFNEDLIQKVGIFIYS